MSGLRGVFSGVLALVALQAVVSSDAAAARTGGLLTDVADIARRVLDPNVPAIPDLRMPAADRSSGQPAAGRGIAQPPELEGLDNDAEPPLDFRQVPVPVIAPPTE